MEALKAGFTYTTDLYRNGEFVERTVDHNIVPDQMLNHILSVLFKGDSASPNYYVGLFEGNYTPVAGDTMAAFPAASTEMTAYAETTRQAVTFGAVASGNVDNTAALATFTGNTAGKQALGGFVCTSPTKGGTGGILCSAVQFSSPRSLAVGEELRVTVGFQIASA